MPDPTSKFSRVSLRDIAAQVGVSHVTVSLALRGDPRVSATRKAEIVAVANRLGYQPDPMLASLSAYRRSKRPVNISSSVAWINQWTNPRDLRKLQEFDAYWTGARDYAERLGYRLEEFVVGPHMTPDGLQKILRTRNVRGILIPPHSSGLHLPGFDWSEFALVRFGTSVATPRAHIVTSDQVNCASMAFERVWERGYRRIGYITSVNFEKNTGGNFRAGYLRAQDHHLKPRQHLSPVFLEGESLADNAKALRSWLRKAKPDAVVATYGSLKRLLDDLGCRVPTDLAVATLSVLDGHFDSGVDQNSREVGRVAMATLAALIHHNEKGIPPTCQRILVEGRWIDGTSLPPAKRAALAPAKS